MSRRSFVAGLSWKNERQFITWRHLNADWMPSSRIQSFDLKDGENKYMNMAAVHGSSNAVKKKHVTTARKSVVEEVPA